LFPQTFSPLLSQRYRALEVRVRLGVHEELGDRGMTFDGSPDQRRVPILTDTREKEGERGEGQRDKEGVEDGERETKGKW
jgi:hypothetical protein